MPDEFNLNFVNRDYSWTSHNSDKRFKSLCSLYDKNNSFSHIPESFRVHSSFSTLSLTSTKFLPDFFMSS